MSRLILLVIISFFCLNNKMDAQAEVFIVGPSSLCLGECGTYEVVLFDSTDFIIISDWSFNGLSLTGNPVTFCMDSPDGGELTVSGFTEFQQDFFAEIYIEASSFINPVIVSTSAQCPDSLAACDRICAFNTAVYEVTNVSPGSAVSWQVFGAESFTPNGNEVTVEWGAPGQGEVSAVVSSGGGSAAPLQIFCGVNQINQSNPNNLTGEGYLNIEGGTAPYTVVLLGPNGDVTTLVTDADLTFPNLFSGDYIVEVVDAQGVGLDCNFYVPSVPDECWSTLNPVTIDQPSPGCNTCDGFILVNPVGGSAGTSFSFLWSNGSTSNVLTDVCPGVYSVTSTDANGCSYSINIEMSCDSLGSTCFGESSLCVEILDEPKARIGATPPVVNGVIEICQGQTVYFENESEGAASYIWDFGDLNTSVQFEPDHTYQTTGTYTVSLIARNECFCSDTTFVDVNVLPADVPEINCVGTVCQGESVTYSTDAMCGTYSWDISPEGTILDGGGPADNFVTVEWMNGDEGVVSLSVSGCAGSVCTTPNVVPIPIISPTAQIIGRTSVCEESTEEYYIPNYQGTEIVWSVQGSGTIMEGQGTERVTINWYGQANQSNPQKVRVEFDNCYLGCEGQAELDVNIVPSFYLRGPIEVCEKTTEEFTCRNSITNLLTPINWQVLNAGGAVVAQSPGAVASFNIDWSVPLGTYTVQGRPAVATDFCNELYEIFVDVRAAPVPVNSILGEDNICPGETYPYEADGIPSHDFNWTIIGGTPDEFKGNPINVTWGPTPPYQVSVTQTATTGLGCTSDPISMDLMEIPAFPINGDAQVCMEETGIYNAPYFERVSFDWVVSPANRGTVISGQGSSTIEVLWHEAGPATVEVTVCGVVQDFNVTVLPLPEPIVVHPDEICEGSTTPVSTTTPYVSYRWLDDTGALVSIDAVPDLGPGYYELVVVDVNGCEGSTSFDIFELPLPAISISVPIYEGICPGGPAVTITASTTSDGYDFQWYQNGVPVGTNSPFLTVNVPDSYNVIVTDVNGCTNLSKALIIEDCESQGGTCDGGICIPATCNNPNGCTTNGMISFEIQKTGDCLTHQYINTSINDIAGSWSWEFDDPGPNNTSTLENPLHTFSGVGYYSIIFLGLVPDLTTGGTCPDGQMQQDTIIAMANFDMEAACPGAPAVFTDLSEILPYATLTNWDWDFGDPASGMDNTSTDQHPTHVYQSAGTYTVTLTITEASGCQTSIVKNITVFDPPAANFALPAITCENTAVPFNAVVSADATSIEWDFGDPASGAANTSTNIDTYHEFATAGIYTVTLTATNVYGCATTFTENIAISPNTLGGNIAFSQPSPICEGDNITLTAPAGGISYLWSNNDPTNQITVGTANVYEVTLTDAEGCTYAPPGAQVDIFGEPNGIIKAVEYNEFNQPVAFYENNHTVCEGEDVYLVIQGSLDYSYQWSGGNGGGAEISFTEDRDNLLDVGVHNFAVTVTDNTTGCTSEEGPFTVTVNPKPDVQISSLPTGFLCANTPATLSVVSPNGSLDYTWNTGEMGTSIFVIAGGTYFAQATNQFGCKSRSNEIELNNAPDIDKIPTGCHTRCNPDTLCLPNMPLVASYQWFYNGAPMAAPNGTVAEPIFDQSGEYYVQMVDIYGCESISETLTLDLYPGFGDVLGDVYFDVNENGIIDGPDTLVSGIDIFINNGTINIDTVTSDLGGYAFLDILSTDYTVVLDTANLPAGWSAYYVDGNVQLVGCDVEEEFDWLLTNQCVPETVNETYQDCPGGGVTYNGTFIPTGQTDTFTVTSLTGCDTILIINVDPFTTVVSQEELGACTGTTVTYEGADLSPGDMQDFTLTDQNGCDSIVQVTVEEWLNYTMPLPLTACEGSSTVYNGQTLFPGDQQDFLFVTVNGCDSLMQVTVNAAPVDTVPVPLQVCEGETIDFNGQQLSAGDQVSLTLVNQFGCDSVLEVSVTQYDVVTFDLDAGEICWNGTDGEIEVMNPTGGATPYLVSLDGTNYQPALTFENLSAGAYTVYLLDDNDCQYEDDTEIPMIEPMVVETVDETIECGDELELAPLVISELPVIWQWAGGSSDSVLLISNPGIYNFSVSNDCETVNEGITVGLEAAGLDGMIYMPNSFSPNNDGINDCYKGFLAPDIEVDYFVLKIFDRWGNAMFETNDPNDCWNGHHRGKQMQPNVFAWYMELRVRNCDGNLLEVYEEGDIHLMD
ncbi:MAG: PKD domain-containing protein [Bacteroidota bacterium]